MVLDIGPVHSNQLLDSMYHKNSKNSAKPTIQTLLDEKLKKNLREITELPRDPPKPKDAVSGLKSSKHPCDFSQYRNCLKITLKKCYHEICKKVGPEMLTIHHPCSLNHVG